MESKFNKIKNVFDHDAVKLPEDFNWDQMEEGIMNKMNALEPKTERSSRRIWLFIVLALLFISVPGSLFLYNHGIRNSEEGDFKQNKKSKSYEGTQPSASVSDAYTTYNDKDLSNKESIVIQASAKNEDIKSGTPESHIAQSKVESIAQSKPKSNSNSIFTGNKEKNIENSSAGIGFSNLFANDKEQNAKLEKNSDIPRLLIEKENSGTLLPVENKLIDQTLENLAFLPSSALTEFETAYIQLGPLFTKPYSNIEKSALLPTHQIGITSGISLWSFSYGSVLPERNAYEKNILSFSTQVSYTYRFGNNFTFTTGLQYQKLQSRLDWSRELDNHTIVFRDTILEVHTNALTGEQMSVRGDVEIEVEAVRNVRHFNQYRLYQIPVLIGKSWTAESRWHMNISVGGAINIHSMNNGRNIYEGELIEMNGSVTDFLDNRWNFQFQAQYGLGYRFNEKWGALAQLGYQKSLTNWSRETVIHMRPGFINLSFGINYTL